MTIDRIQVSGLCLPRLAYGCGGVWGKPWFGETRAAELLKTALDCGIDLFDTGPTYSGGFAESRLGRLLAIGGEEAMVSTKVGTHLNHRGRTFKDYTPNAVKRSFRESLARLRRERVEILYIHGPLEPADLTTELVNTLLRFKQDGLATLIGASCDGVVAEKALRLPLDIMMMTINPYVTENLRIATTAKELGRIVVAKSPMGGGRASFPRRPLFQRESMWANARTLYNARKQPLILLKRRNTKPSETLQATLRLDAVDAAVVGTLNTEHLMENCSLELG